MSKFNECSFRKLLLDNLSSSNEDIAFSYKALFNIHPDLSFFRHSYQDWIGNDDEWFRNFHKLIRQCDIYEFYRCYDIVNTGTDEENKELKIVRQTMNQMLFAAKNDDDLKITKNSHQFLELKKRREELSKKIYVETDRDINGYLDVLLYNTISMDNNVLYNILVKTFNQYKENESNKKEN